MMIRGLASLVTLAFVLLLSGCGAGSGRANTADLQVVATAAPSGQANGGDVVAFVMTVTNKGPFSAENVSIRNTTLQVSQSGLSIVCAASGGASCPGTTGTQMTVSSMPSGSSLAFTISGNANVGASGTISDTMTASSDTTDGDSSNNSATASGTVVSNDVSVVGTAPAGPLVSGTAIYTMTVSNAGPDAASNVVLTTTASSDLTLNPADISCTSSGGATDALLQPDGTQLVQSIPAAATLVCSVPVTVNITTNGFAIVSMTAASAGDERTSNNSASASVNATLTNDVGVVVTPPSGPLTSGNTQFTALITNAGPATATGVVIANTFSSTLSLSGAINCTPSGGATGPTLQGDGTLLVASLPVSGSLSCVIPLTVATSTTGTVFDTMTVSASGDTRPGNNSSTGTVSATLNADLAVSGTAADSSVVGGENTSFTMVVTNNGPAPAADVSLTNVLSSDLTLNGSIACTAAGGASTPVSTSGTITVAAMPVASTVTCTVPVTVMAGANGTVVSTFTAASTSDSQTRNNTVSVSTVARSSSLSLSQSVATQIIAGTTGSFSAVLTNAGPSAASNVQITWSHTTASGLVFDAPTCAASVGATCPATLGATMSVDSLPVGRTLTFTFRVTPSTTYRGTVSNTVTAVSTEDPVLKTSTATSTVVDARSGTYSVFAADGQAYSLVVDFDAGTYTMSGVARTFTGPTSGDYVVGGGVAGERLRTTEDLVVGTHAFDGVTPLPYVAARTFVSNLTGMAGTYNLASRTVAGGVGSTHVGTAQIANGVLSICQSDTTQVQTVTACSTTGARKDYLNLTVNGDGTVTGTTASGESYTFVVADSGATKLLLSARTVPSVSPTTRELRIGLPDSTARLIAGPQLHGPALLPPGGSFSGTVTDWVTGDLTVGTTSSVALSGLSSTYGYVDSSTLAVINTGVGPYSMLTGSSNFYVTRSFYLMQGYPLVVVVGGNSGFGGADGLLQILVP